MIRSGLLSLITLVIVLCFQNCARVSIEDGATKSSQSPQAESGGQPYDGKMYIVAGTCGDETSVISRILVKSAEEAVLLRENCVDVAPVILPPETYTLIPAQPARLIYNSQVFIEEVPPPQPAGKVGYAQWNNPFVTLPAPGVFHIDGLGYTASEIQQLKSAGHTVICMITAGVVSTRFADFNQFSSADLGNMQPGTSDYWLDTRSSNVRSILIQRLDQVRVKGCDGILWDQTDAHDNNSGFPLTNATGVDFARFLALATKNRGLMAVLANTGDLVPQLVDYFDMQFAQNCYQSNICGRYEPFVNKGKPVFISDTSAFSSALCSQAATSSYTLWFTSPNQDGSRYEPCP